MGPKSDWSEQDYKSLDREAFSIIEEIGVDKREFEFTGFKLRDTRLLREAGGRSYPEEGAVGQWVAYRYGKTFYVNVPGMESGIVGKGAMFDIGSKRVFPADDLRPMILEGLEKLKALVKENSSGT